MTPNYAERARVLVHDCILADPVEAHITLDEVFVVWFCKTLKNWKALVSTTHPNAFYYEVTHNGDTGETYVDIYTKADQVVVEPIEAGDLK